MLAKVEASTWYVSCSTRLSKLCEGATVSKGLRRDYHMYRTTILGVGGGEDTHNKIRGVGVDPYKSIFGSLSHRAGSGSESIDTTLIGLTTMTSCV